MGKTLENQELHPEKFPNLEYIVLDVRKTLRHDKITPDNPEYELLLDTAIRMTLLKGKFGVLMPGQPSSEKDEWFEKIKEELAPNKSAKGWEIESARRQQLQEERRTGQTHEEGELG